MAALYGLSIALLIAASCIKNKMWAMLCRIAVIGWLVFVIITSFSSINEDATIIALILTITAGLAMVFGVRHKVGRKDG